MINSDAALNLMQNYGLWLLAPIAILEGPIITVIAGYLAHLKAFNIIAAFIVVVLADLVGDVLLYLFGGNGLNWVSPKWRNRLGLTKARLAELVKHFHTQGGRTLVIAKLTHSLGALALISAGVARMPIRSFIWYNLLASLPKSLFFIIIGYSLGYAYEKINAYIFWLSLVPLLIFTFLGVKWYLKRKEGK